MNIFLHIIIVIFIIIIMIIAEHSFVGAVADPSQGPSTLLTDADAIPHEELSVNSLTGQGVDNRLNGADGRTYF